MATMRTATAVLVLFAAATLPAMAQRPEVAARAEAYVKALSSGSADQFEAMAQANFAAALLARPAEQRRQMVARVHDDFGPLTLAAETLTSPTHLDLTMKSASNDMPMVIGMDFEEAAPFRITQVSIRVGGPGGGGRGGPPSLPAPPIDGRMSTAEITAALDAYLAGLSRSGEFAGVVAIAKDGQTIFRQAYGIADRERQTPMNVDLRFNLASIGKAFTKVAIGQLLAAGTLKPGDTVGALLPDYPNAAAKAATIDQLLNMRGGIADFFGEAFAEDAEGSVPVQSRLFQLRGAAAAHLPARLAHRILQRLLRGPRRDHRQRSAACRTSATSSSTCSTPPA